MGLGTPHWQPIGTKAPAQRAKSRDPDSPTSQSYLCIYCYGVSIRLTSPFPIHLSIDHVQRFSTVGHEEGLLSIIGKAILSCAASCAFAVACISFDSRIRLFLYLCFLFHASSRRSSHHFFRHEDTICFGRLRSTHFGPCCSC